MMPVKLKMKNFLSYEEEEFDFTKITNATVTGRNGAGKSSFCTDAITWVLFGKGSRGGDKDGGNYVSTGSDSCTVELSFSVDGAAYKVIRTLNSVRGNRTALSLFAVADDGSEVPVAAGSVTETQKAIESLLRMTYRTFTASSMIFQNKSSEFTSMSDAERKEALSGILDIGGWDTVASLAKEDAARLKSEIDAIEVHAEHYRETVAREKDCLDRQESVRKRLDSLACQKEDQKKILEKHQRTLFLMEEADAAIAKKQQEISAIDSSIAKSSAEIREKQAEAERLSKLTDSNAESIAEQMAVQAREEEIRKACEEEKMLQKQLEAIARKHSELAEAQKALHETTERGIRWKTAHENELSSIEKEIMQAEEQAKAMSKMPCASSKEMSGSCPLLSMARKATASLGSLKEKQSRIQAEQNPFRQEWLEANARVKSLGDTGNMADVQAALAKVQEVSRLRPVLDRAVENLALLVGQRDSNKKGAEAARKRISELRDIIASFRQDKEKLQEELNGMKDAMQPEARKEALAARKTLESIEASEKECLSALGECSTLLSQITDAKRLLAEAASKTKEKASELADVQLLLEACGKKSGVPALIVENALPELESTANRILENMMDGRLQLRLDTQAETAKGTMREVLRITVLDDGFERRYETYSGAEKFVVDLSLRIALSKFLCRRAGASVQMFVLDEGVSCADGDNREEIMKAVRSITGEFAKVLFVTHIDELKDSLDQRIEVTRNSQGSHIRISA